MKEKHLLFVATECNFPSHVPDVAVSGKRNPVPREEHLSEEHLCCTDLSCFHDSSHLVLEEWKYRCTAHAESDYIFSHWNQDPDVGYCTLCESEEQPGKQRKGKLSCYHYHSPLLLLQKLFPPLSFKFVLYFIGKKKSLGKGLEESIK